MVSKRLDICYFSQNDNSPWRSDGAGGNTQCNATSHTMLVASLIPDFVAKSKLNGFPEPEDYFKSKLYKYTTDRGDHAGYTRCLKEEFGIESQWRYDLTRQDLIDSINAGVACVLGLEYKLSGHITIATGYDNDFVYINDPYGVRNGSCDSYNIVNQGLPSTLGKNDAYSWGVLRYVWLSDGGGWGRIVTSVKGKPTGLQKLIDAKE